MVPYNVLNLEEKGNHQDNWTALPRQGAADAQPDVEEEACDGTLVLRDYNFALWLRGRGNSAGRVGN